MRAARIHRFGGPELIRVEDVPIPIPTSGEILVRVSASGVGPWDAIIREGKSRLSPQPPLTLGSDISGTVVEFGFDAEGFEKGDEVFGVTNPQFCGGNAEYTLASAGMITRKPKHLSHTEAASVPVVAVTAWQMLFDYARLNATRPCSFWAQRVTWAPMPCNLLPELDFESWRRSSRTTSITSDLWAPRQLLSINPADSRIPSVPLVSYLIWWGETLEIGHSVC